MKAKLFKTGNEFLLQSEDGKTLGITSGITVGRKLSIKNCEAIEFGYDLDELAENTYREYPTDLKDAEYHYNRDYQVHKKRKAFIKGFKKALEILGDKKFSEDDIKKAFNVGWIQRHNEEGSHYEAMEKVIQSLQQTEFDVEIEMEKYGYCEGCNRAGMWHCAHADSCGNAVDLERPKLDADSCLILRRI